MRNQELDNENEFLQFDSYLPYDSTELARCSNFYEERDRQPGEEVFGCVMDQ